MGQCNYDITAYDVGLHFERRYKSLALIGYYKREIC